MPTSRRRADRTALEESRASAVRDQHAPSAVAHMLLLRVCMDCRGMLRLLPLLACALSTPSCMSDAESWFSDLFAPAPEPRPIEELFEPDVDISSRDPLYG